MDPVSEFEAGLAEVERSLEVAFQDASTEQALRAANARIAGPTGTLTAVMKRMKDVPKDRRKELGQRANAVKQSAKKLFDDSLLRIALAARNAELNAPSIDVTLPGRAAPVGGLHPLTRVAREILDIFQALGFDIATGPEVELAEYNFDKLNFPPDHPAMDMQDTFFVERDGKVDPSMVMRTHTSGIQVREMLKSQPPLAVIAPGAVFRRDESPKHSPMFCQIEGLLVDEGVSFADLKGVLTVFAQRVFENPNMTVRLRPSYFPFVEPGAEVDLSCPFCKPWEGDSARVASCRLCKGAAFIEVLGCGMVHPAVFENVGIDPERYTGFAFGMGVDRIAMLKYGISEIRHLYENDMRFLTQF